MTYEKITEAIAIIMLSYFPTRPSYDEWIRVIAALKNYFGIETTHRILMTKFKDEQPNEHYRQLGYNLEQIRIGSFIKMAMGYGFRWDNNKSDESLNPIGIEKGGYPEYWNQYMDRNKYKQFEEKGLLSSLKSFSFRSKKGEIRTIKATRSNPIFSVPGGENRHKIIKPLELRKQFKYQWLNYQQSDNGLIWGLDTLSDNCEYIIIVEGVKDWIVATANDIPSIAIDSVNSPLTEDLILSLTKKTKKIILCLDNDEPGQKRAVELSGKYNIWNYTLPKAMGEEKIKDISDFIKYSRKNDMSQIDKLKSEFAALPNNSKEIESTLSKKDSTLVFTPPGFDDVIYRNLPPLLADALNKFSYNHEKDMFILSALVAISACLPNYYGKYYKKKYGSNLYVFIIAPAASGKGTLDFSRILVEPIDEFLREYTEDTGEADSKKKWRGLIIPANSSSSGFLELLCNNNGHGLIFESEGDSLSQIQKTEYGNYSDLLRKSNHHESITMYRRTGKELNRIPKPYLSVVLSGTPNQIKPLIPSAENGLLSRFIFYTADFSPEMGNVFDESDNTETYFINLSKEIFSLWSFLKGRTELTFRLTVEQQKKFMDVFTDYHKDYESASLSIPRRMGLHAFRLMMVFTALRLGTGGLSEPVVYCDDVDFENALCMVDILMEHSFAVYDMLPTEEHQYLSDNKQKFIDELPLHFKRNFALNVGKKYHLSRTGVDRFLTSNLFIREAHGFYGKK